VTAMLSVDERSTPTWASRCSHGAVWRGGEVERRLSRESRIQRLDRTAALTHR
jgi:hypothetical protein